MIYSKEKIKIKSLLKSINYKNIKNFKIDYICEKLKKWDKQKTSTIISWHKKNINKNKVQIKKIPLNQMKHWIVDKN